MDRLDAQAKRLLKGTAIMHSSFGLGLIVLFFDFFIDILGLTLDFVFGPGFLL